MIQPSRIYLAEPLASEVEQAVGVRSFIVRSPIPVADALIGSDERAYLIDLTALDSETLDRLLVFLARKLGATPEILAVDMAAHGNVFPVRESQVSGVSIDARAFL